MNKIIAAIEKNACEFPNAIALKSKDREISYAELLEEIAKIETKILPRKSFALMAANCLEWMIFDLACLKNEVNFIAIPHFFSAAQIKDLLEKARPELVVFSEEFAGVFAQEKIREFGDGFFGFDRGSLGESCHRGLDPRSPPKPLSNSTKPPFPNTSKITFTSGSTGNPKGVCLSNTQIENVVFALQKRVGTENIVNNLSLLPLSILLENIAGVYLTLISGGCAIIAAPSESGISQSSGVDTQKFAAAIAKYQPQSLILVPELARLFIELTAKKIIDSRNFLFIAVGGAKIAKETIEQAFSLRIPLYQGYGLSEFSSVVTLNSIKENRAGSVGKPLDHVEIKIADDGEILLKGNAFLGYLGEEKFGDEFYRSGDLGEFDEDSFLWINGRKKNVFITAMSRNVSPEWLESEFLQSKKIAQIFVYGEALAQNVAVIVPLSGFDESEIQKINQKLPDYARIGRIILAKEPFSFKNGLLTANGRMRREAIFKEYEREIFDDDGV